MAETNHKCRGICNLITTEDKAEIYNVFNKLDKQSKMKFINDSIRFSEYNLNERPKEHRSYYLPVKKTRKRVCRQTFLETLKISVNDFRWEFLCKNLKKNKELFCSNPPSTDSTVNLSPPKVSSRSSKVDVAVQTDLSYLSDQEALKVVLSEVKIRTIRVTTMMNVMKNPKLFVGVSSAETIIKIRKDLGSTKYDLFIVFQKIRLNSSIEELALYYETSVDMVLQILNLYTLFIAHNLLDTLKWQEPQAINDEMKLDLRLTFNSVRSIIKLLRVRISRVATTYKCFVSFSPHGVINHVSKVVQDEAPNVLMFNNRFLNEIPKNSAVVLERDLMDVTDFLNRQGHAVFMRSKFKNNAFYDEQTNRLCDRADRVFNEFQDFEILRNFDQTAFKFLPETESLQSVVIIIAGLLNTELLAK